MYTSVVVLTYQPPGISTYTYAIPKDLEKSIKVGQLVSVPFGKRLPQGIVVGISDKVPPLSGSAGSRTNLERSRKVNLKSITAILFPSPLLLPYQIKLLKWLSFYYRAPMVNCLEALIPEIPHGSSQIMRVTRAQRVPSSARSPRASLNVSLSLKPSALPPSYRTRTSDGTSSWQDPQKTQQRIFQTLVLVPTINRLPQTLAQYPQAKNYVIYHSELKISEKFATWQKIQGGNVDFVFGSRMAIFTPCPNLKKIIIFDEHEPAYKDERSPYYDTLTVAEKISQLSGCQIQIIDSSPKITTYFSHKEAIMGGWQEWKGTRPHFASLRGAQQAHSTGGLARRSASGGGRETGDRTRRPMTPTTKIISMLAEKAAGNKLPISDTLMNYLKLAIQKNRTSLLFLNKKVETGHYYCKNCKQNDFATKQPEQCPNCQSQDIWFNSLNVTSLANLVKKTIPGSKVNIITQKQQAVLSGEKPTVHIATASVFYKLKYQKYDLVAHVQADSALHLADFNSAEKLYSQITNLKELTKVLLLLQTYNPENNVILQSLNGNYQQFFQNQITERKALNYPPYSLLVKLTLKGKKDEFIAKGADALFAQLNRQTATGQPSTFSILGPYQPFFAKTLQYNIILKVPVVDYNLSTRQKAIEKVKQYLALVPKDWQVTVEPESLN